MKKAIVIGASSGIGRALSIILAEHGYLVGVAARRGELLSVLQAEYPQAIKTCVMDVRSVPSAIAEFNGLVTQLGGVDLVIIASGVGYPNQDLSWDPEQETIEVNVTGFTALATTAMRHFIRQGSGHLVGISSVAALRGGKAAPAYHASKAYITNYLQGLRQKVQAQRIPIVVTEICPGFVDTAMMKGDGAFWVASETEAAEQIYRAIINRRKHVYVTRRWRLVAWLFKLLPEFIYNRL